MLVYFCISSHGYGHAARQSSIINELYKVRPHWRYVLSTYVSADFFSNLLRGVPFEYRRCKWDIGVLQSNALDLNINDTLHELNKLEFILPNQIQEELDWINLQNSKVIVIGDIPPSAVKLAKALSTYIILTANFGWDDIYAELGHEFRTITNNIKKSYSEADLLIRFPFSLEMKWNIPEHKVAMTANKVKPIPEFLKDKINSFKGEKVAIGFGGFGYKFPIELCSKWKEFLFILKSQNYRTNITSCVDNIIYLPRDVDLVDVFPYCSRIIGKPGYSTFCEALTHDLGFHLVERKGFIESKALSLGLVNHGKNRLLKLDSFLRGDWQLDKELIEPKKSLLPIEGAKESARIILNYIQLHYN